MKQRKKLLSLLLVVCLTVGVAPVDSTSVKAEGNDVSALEVAGVKVTSDEYYITSNGTIETGTVEEYNIHFVEKEEKCTLTLKDATIHADSVHDMDNGAGVYYYTSCEKPLEITLEGTNTIYGEEDCGYSAAVFASAGNLTIGGNGVLNAYGADIVKDYDYFTTGIMVTNGDLTIQGGTITAINGESVAGAYGVLVSSGNINMEKGTLYANCIKEEGEVVSRAVDTENGCSVGIFNDTSYSGSDEIGNIHISGGTVYAYGGNSDILSGGIVGQNNVTVSNGEVHAVSGTVKDSRNYAIGATKYVTIEDGKVYATAGKTTGEANSYGIGAEVGLSIRGGEVTAVSGVAEQASSFAIGSGTISITGGKVTTRGGKAAVSSYGIGGTQAITMQGGEVNATSGEAPLGFGIGSNKTISIDGSVVTATGVTMGIGAEDSVTFGSTYQIYVGSTEDNKVLLTDGQRVAGYKYVYAEPKTESTPQPTVVPSSEPSVNPTAEPTAEPVVNPTAQPSMNPTAQPTTEPVVNPTAQPTTEPAVATNEPAVAPAVTPEASQSPSVGNENRNLPKHKKGTKFTKVGAKKNKATYTVTKAANRKGKKGTVQYMSPADKNKTKITIPKKIKVDGITYTVTAIAKEAFKNCTALKRVTMESNIDKIGQKAFYHCTNLCKIKIKSKTLTEDKIGEKAFEGIKQKATFKVPKKKLEQYKIILQKKGVSQQAEFKNLK